MEDIIAAILVLVLIVISIWIFLTVLDFFIEVPEQLKRIADALEKRNGHG